jgi:maltooligosyltrehalose trehalohydrolase
VSAAHRMPFGTRIGAGRDDGEDGEREGVLFQLWAPGATRVELEVEGEGEGGMVKVEVPRGAEGWHRRRLPAAKVGSHYRFRIDGEVVVPDPASRFQPRGVHGVSQVMDPDSYEWRHPDWTGRPWREAVFYELHTGTFTRRGTFAGIQRRLDHLVELGVSAVQLMPVAAFSGTRGWGYDGVLPFAPHSRYGSPDSLRELVDAAHERGLMVFLDVVYNHFGPDGNYLHRYAPGFFTDRFETPWGDAIDFSRGPVREFFIHNALYWLEEFRFDGLRLDAVHAIHDESPLHVLEELAARVRRRFHGRRHVHLVLENGRNESRYLRRGAGGRPEAYAAQWNDDLHHACHVVATGEADGYYEPYADDPVRHLGRCLAEGFAFQGEAFSHWSGRPRGEPSRHLPATAFVTFLQNHDQVGNRAQGERITELSEPRALDALLTILLLAPSPPLVFMGQEWAAPEPFLFFCDFEAELGEEVREGRLREFESFRGFGSPGTHERIPDPNAPETFVRSVLDWAAARRKPHTRWLARFKALLGLRRREITPRLQSLPGGAARWTRFGRSGLQVQWTLGDGSLLTLQGNLGTEPVRAPPRPWGGRILESTRRETGPGHPGPALPAWDVTWYLSG